MMHGQEKSGPAVVARKLTNVSAGAEPAEPRAGAKGNADQAGTHRTPRRRSVSPGRDRVRQAARERSTEKFTALLHHIDVDLLRWAYFQLKREAAAGVDGLTWRDYGDGLAAKLSHLHARIHRGGYRAQPSRRRYIPKPDGRQRPHRGAGGQDRPAGDGRTAECHLRGGLPRLQLRFPGGSQPARCAGCTGGGDRAHGGELDPGRRHRRLLGSCFILHSGL